MKVKIHHSEGEYMGEPTSTKNPHELYELGLELMKKGEAQEAITHFKKAVELDPEYAKAWCALGIAQFKATKKLLLQPFQTAVRLDPSLAKAWMMLGEVWNRMGNNKSAITAYENYTKLQPKDSKGWFGLGIVYWNAKQYQKAAEAFRETAKLEPNNPRVWRELGSAYYSGGQYEEAVICLHKALELEPGDYNTRMNLEKVQIRLSKERFVKGLLEGQ